MSAEMRDELEGRGIKRKRDAKRRRASMACETCRKQKEKCEGGPPCWRCERLGRPCHFQPQPVSKQATCTIPTTHTPQILDSDSQRVRHLETIVRHFLGDVPLDEDNLAQIAARCSAKDTAEGLCDVNEPFNVQFVSRNVAFYSGEFSHWNFSEKLRRSMNDRRNTVDAAVKEYWRPTHLQSSIHIIAETLRELPPRQIADFLINVFFKYAEVNNFYAERTWVQEKLNICYNSKSEYSTSDISWVCSLFAILAIGTQMAHMEEDKSTPESNSIDDISVCSEDSVGLNFYRAACRLIPDVILAASHESAQAFLLLAVYALPVSTGGLSYTYFGLALKMAIQNGMHRRCSEVDCDVGTMELRNRLFWTIYSLERRTSIMHGRPISLTRSDISADLPTNHSTFKSPNFSNMTKFINLVFWTGEVAETLSSFKRGPKRLIPDYSERLIQLRAGIRQWWDSLPVEVECRDLDPTGPLFRQNCHLKLCYLLIYIYMGRPFIFQEKRKECSPERQSSTTRSRWYELVDDCVQSALAILNTLQLLSDHHGLCRASYTEFSSCRAALLVILAQSLTTGRSAKLQEALKRGMTLIRQMLGGTSSDSEISYIESFEAAIHELISEQEQGPSARAHIEQNPLSAYARFKDWTQSMKKDKVPASYLELASFSPQLNLSPGSDEMTLSYDAQNITDFFNPSWPSGDLGLDSGIFEIS